MDNTRSVTIIPPYGEDLLDLTLNNSYSAGTVSLTLKVRPTESLKELTQILGLTCRIERIGPTLAHGVNAFKMECRITPPFNNEYISIDKVDLGDGDTYSVTELVNDAASQAGTTVAVMTADKQIQSFKSQGRFKNALESLAAELCGVLLQQNSSWYIISKNAIMGDYTIDVSDVESISQSEESDIIDEIASLAGALLDATKQTFDLAEEIEDLKEEIEDLEEDQKKAEDAIKEETSSDDSTPADPGQHAEYMSNISFQFGRVNNGSWQPIDHAITVEGVVYHVWEGEEGSVLNVHNPEEQYYQIVEDRNLDGSLNGKYKGLHSLQGVELLYEIQIPSNSNGLYFARGRSLNISELSSFDNIWTSLECVTRTVKVLETDEWVKKYYFKFSPSSHTAISPELGLEVESTPAIDNRLYMVDIEVRYMPKLIEPWQFTGETAPNLWPVIKNGLYIGMVDPDGSFQDVNGSLVTEVDALEDLPGSVAPLHCIIGSNGSLAAISDGQSFTTLAGVHCGVISSIDPYLILLGNNIDGKLVGSISGTLPVGKAWPGFGAAASTAPPLLVNFLSKIPSSLGYDFSAFDPENPSDWIPEVGKDPLTEELENKAKELERLKQAVIEKEADAAILASLITCLTKQLSYYGAGNIASLAADILTVYKPLVEEQARQSKLNITDTQALRVLYTTLATYEKTIFSAVSSCTVQVTRTDCTFLYTGSLPLPGNSIACALENISDLGIVESVSLNLKSGLVSISAIKYAR